MEDVEPQSKKYGALSALFSIISLALQAAQISVEEKISLPFIAISMRENIVNLTIVATALLSYFLHFQGNSRNYWIYNRQLMDALSRELFFRDFILDRIKKQQDFISTESVSKIVRNSQITKTIGSWSVTHKTNGNGLIAPLTAKITPLSPVRYRLICFNLIFDAKRMFKSKNHLDLLFPKLAICAAMLAPMYSSGLFIGTKLLTLINDA